MPAEGTIVHKQGQPPKPPHMPVRRTGLMLVVPQALLPPSWRITGAETSTGTPQCPPCHHHMPQGHI